MLGFAFCCCDQNVWQNFGLIVHKLDRNFDRNEADWRKTGFQHKKYYVFSCRKLCLPKIDNRNMNIRQNLTFTSHGLSNMTIATRIKVRNSELKKCLKTILLRHAYLIGAFLTTQLSFCSGPSASFFLCCDHQKSPSKCPSDVKLMIATWMSVRKRQSQRE